MDQSCDSYITSISPPCFNQKKTIIKKTLKSLSHDSSLLSFLKKHYPDALKERFGITDIGEDAAVLEAIADVRKIVNAKGEKDLLRAESLLLKEFKEGKLGRITLEIL